jgi:hypothetical protein
MRSIERRFRHYQEKDPNQSTFLNFSRAVRGQGFSRDAIGHWFNKLVDKDDYARDEKHQLLMYLRFISALEDGLNQARNGPEEGEEDQA